VTGSSLANDGVPGAKKKIEDLIKAGGGVFFLDEAYQLASGNSYNGKAVLDFLLAEIEERRGKIVFILAGYRKEMEKFSSIIQVSTAACRTSCFLQTTPTKSWERCSSI
jgi:hypothetical protein